MNDAFSPRLLGVCLGLTSILALQLIEGPANAQLIDSGSRTTPTAPAPRGLGSPLFAERESASSALLDAGPDAYEQARAALESDDPEIRWRAEELIQRLEVRSLVEPIRIAGLEGPVTLSEAIRRLELSTGSRFRPQLGPDRTVRFPLATAGEGAPTFWEALERLRLDAAWSIETDPRRASLMPDPQLRLVDREPMPVASIVGPLRLVVREFATRNQPPAGRRPGAGPPNGPREGFESNQLRLELQSEPRLRFRLIEPLRVLSATGRDGRVTHVEAEEPGLEGLPSESAPFTCVAGQSVVLRPLGGARVPAHLQVRAIIEMETRRPEPLVVDLETTANSAMLPQPVRLDDATITALRVDRPPGSVQPVLDVTIQPDDMADFLARRRFGRQRFDMFNQMLERPMRQFDLVDERGEVVRFEPARRFAPVPQGFRMVAPIEAAADARPPVAVRLYTSIRASEEWTFDLEGLTQPVGGP